MGMFDKLIGGMRIDNDDDEFYDDDDEYYEEEEKPSRGLFGRRKDDDYDDDDDDYKKKSSRNKVNAAQRRTMEVSMVKPTAVEDAREITNLLLSGKAVVLNMEGIHTEVAQRIIDFTSGATFAMNGKLQKISNYIFIATPDSVDLSGDFQDLLNSGNFDVSGFNMRF